MRQGQHHEPGDQDNIREKYGESHARTISTACSTACPALSRSRGIGTTIKELAELLLRQSGCKTPIQYLASGPTFVTHRIGCTKRAERDLGFRWSVDLEDGMRSLIDWRRRQSMPLAA